MQRRAKVDLLRAGQGAHIAHRGQRQSSHGSEQLGKCAMVQFATGDETQREAGTREEATVMEADIRDVS